MHCGPITVGRRTGECARPYMSGGGLYIWCWVFELGLRAGFGRAFAGLPVKRSQYAIFQHARFGLDPVVQGLAFLLAALVIKMLRVQADLSFEQFGHECLLLFSAGIDIQNKILA